MDINEKIKLLLSRWNKVLNEQENLFQTGKELVPAIREELKNYYSRNGFHIKGEMFETIKRIVSQTNPQIKSLIEDVFNSVTWFQMENDESWIPITRVINTHKVWFEKDNTLTPVSTLHIISNIFQFHPKATSFVFETYDKNELGILVFSDLELLSIEKFALAIMPNISDIQVSVERP